MLAAWMLLAVATSAAAEDEAESPKWEKLDDGRYKIGSIVVNRTAKSFTVPGKILHLKDALARAGTNARERKRRWRGRAAATERWIE